MNPGEACRSITRSVLSGFASISSRSKAGYRGWEVATITVHLDSETKGAHSAFTSCVLPLWRLPGSMVGPPPARPTRQAGPPWGAGDPPVLIVPSNGGGGSPAQCSAATSSAASHAYSLFAAMSRARVANGERPERSRLTAMVRPGPCIAATEWRGGSPPAWLGPPSGPTARTTFVTGGGPRPVVTVIVEPPSGAPADAEWSRSFSSSVSASLRPSLGSYDISISVAGSTGVGSATVTTAVAPDTPIVSNGPGVQNGVLSVRTTATPSFCRQYPDTVITDWNKVVNLAGFTTLNIQCW
jgi:hypothetical protein